MGLLNFNEEPEEDSSDEDSGLDESNHLQKQDDMSSDHENGDYDDDDDENEDEEEEEDDEDEDEEEGDEEDDEVMEGSDDCDTEEASGRKRKQKYQRGPDAKRRDPRYYKIPTVAELTKLRETNTLYHGSIFRSQMEELLEEVSIKDKSRMRLNTWLQRFTTFLQALPRGKQVQLDDVSDYAAAGVQFPSVVLPGRGEDGATFKFSPPSAAAVFTGSFAAGTITTQNNIVDLVIEMPRSCLHRKDKRDGRWLLKRAHFLAAIASALVGGQGGVTAKKGTEEGKKEGKETAQDLVTEVTWTQHMGEPLRPALLVTPRLSRSGSGGWRVQLLPVPPPNFFAKHAFAPQKHNIKHRGVGACPQLNYLCSVDVLQQEHNAVLCAALGALPGAMQAVKLIKVWLGQRGLYKGLGGLSGHVVSLLVLHLFRVRRIKEQMSAYQVFRTVLLYLASSDEESVSNSSSATTGPSYDWTTTGPNMHAVALSTAAAAADVVTDAAAANTAPCTADYHSMYPVVFVDPTGYMNLVGGVTPQIFRQVQHEAKQGIAILAGEQFDSFELLFIRRKDFNLAFDQSIHVTLTEDDLLRYYSPEKPTTKDLLLNQLVPAAFMDPDSSCVTEFPSPSKEDKSPNKGERSSNKVVKSFNKKSKSSNEDASTGNNGCGTIPTGDITPLLPELWAVLSRGLSGRATLVTHRLVAAPQWLVTDPRPTKQMTVTFGLLLDPVKAFAFLTKDTSDGLSSSPEVAEFREFWGPISSLRRFRDSTFKEAVAWGVGTEPLGDCRRIPGKIAKHLLHRHFDIPRASVVHVGPKMEAMLRRPETEAHDNYGTGEAACVAVVEAFDALARLLRGLKLELKVTSVMSSAAALAYAQVFPPLPLPDADAQAEDASSKKHTTTAIEVVVLLERSGKWPADVAAVNAVRQEFHHAMAKQLRHKSNLHAVLDGTHLNVIMRGFLFSVRVTYQGEYQLLKQNVGDTPKDDDDEDEEEEDREAGQNDTQESLQLQVSTTVLPRINSALSSITSRHACYSGCVRLCRRWLSSHLLEPHMPALATQLIVAHLFLQPGVFQVPHTPYIGLMRFLHLMATTDWTITAFFVNLHQDFHSADLAELQRRLSSERTSLPPLVVVTPYDVRGGAAPLGGDTAAAGSAVAVSALSQDTRDFRYRLVSWWTRDAPSNAILCRLRRVAAAALAAYADHAFDPAFDLAVLFRPPTHEYDLQLHLNLATPAPARRHHGGGPMLHTDVATDAELLVNWLRAEYGAWALVFHDGPNGNFVGILRRPNDPEERDWKIGMKNGFSLLDKTSGRVQLDLYAVAAAISINFLGLVAAVTIKK